MGKWLSQFELVERWDEDQALEAWTSMFLQMNERYPAGALSWGEEHMPDLIDELNKAESQCTVAFHKKDLVGVRKATTTFEGILLQIITAYLKGASDNGQMAGAVS